MIVKWKSPILISAVALGFLGVTCVSVQPVDAASGTKLVSNRKLTRNAASRNVTFTGSSALYSKPKGSAGTHLIASKSQLKKLADSTSSLDNFAATQVGTTRNGSVYYTITSFNGKYRGWIYGGRSTKKFAGGLAKFTTFSQTTLPDSLSDYTFKIASPGFANDGKTVTYQQPMNTVIDQGKQIGDSVGYANTTFKIDGIGTRTREGDTWVHITAIDPTDQKANGWILYKGLRQAESPIPDKALRIDLVDSKGNLIRYLNYTNASAQKDQPIGVPYETSWSLGSDDQANIQVAVRNALQGTGYALDALSANQTGFLAQGKFGHKVSLTVKNADPIASNAVRINITNNENAVIDTIDYAEASGQLGQTLGTANGALAATDQSKIQDTITSDLKDSGYQLNQLSNSQLSDLAAAKFGQAVYLKATPTTTTIADNAVRIKFVDPATKKVIRSIDYVNTDADDPAKKGSTLGTKTNDKWTLADSDVVEIKALAKTALSGTGYLLNNETLSDAQQATLATAKFGDTVTIDVGKAANTANTPTPYAYAKSAGQANAQQLVATNNQYVDNSWEFPDVGGSTTGKAVYGKLSATDIANLSGSAKDNFLNALSKDSDNALAKNNDSFKSAAEMQYVDNDQLTGLANTDIKTITSSLGHNAAWTTLQSPKYPIFEKNGNSISLSWQTISYQATSADQDANDNSIKIYYRFDAE